MEHYTNNDYMKRCDVKSLYDETFETREWAGNIPSLRFKEEWEVQIIPPFGGALIRFLVSANDKFLSVYLDGYNMLGGVRGEIYWEVFDGEDIERFKIGESEQMMARIEEKLGE